MKDIRSNGLKPCKSIMALLDRVEICECLGRSIARRILDYGRMLIGKRHRRSLEICQLIIEILYNIGNEDIFNDLEQVIHSEQANEITYKDFELLTYSLSMLPLKNECIKHISLPSLLKVVLNSLHGGSQLKLLDKATSFRSKAILAIAGLKQNHHYSQHERHQKQILSNSDLKQNILNFATFFVSWLDEHVQTAPGELIHDYNENTIVGEYTAEMQMSNMYEERNEMVSITKNVCSFSVTCVL